MTENQVAWRKTLGEPLKRLPWSTERDAMAKQSAEKYQITEGANTGKEDDYEGRR